MSAHRLARKFYCVAVEFADADGYSILRPLRATLQPGAFPEGSTTRFQAKKLLRRARPLFPSAHLLNHRAL